MSQSKLLRCTLKDKTTHCNPPAGRIAMRRFIVNTDRIINVYMIEEPDGIFITI